MGVNNLYNFQLKALACLPCHRTCRTRGASGRAPTSPSAAPLASTPASSTSATPPEPACSLSTSASKCSLAGSRSSSLPCAKRTKVLERMRVYYFSSRYTIFQNNFEIFQNKLGSSLAGSRSSRYAIFQKKNVRTANSFYCLMYFSLRRQWFF